MFTGIISEFRPIIDVEERDNFCRLTIDLGDDLIRDIKIGASVSISGVCLTVTEFDSTQAKFDVMGETLKLTTTGQLKAGSFVNVERSAKQGDEIGGHQLSGHIDGMAEIIEVETQGDNYIVRFFVKDEKLRPYIFNKGYIGIDGASLTIVDWDIKSGEFSVHLIPETLSRTVLGKKQMGDTVNLEIDRATQAIVDTVLRLFEPMIDKIANGDAGALSEPMKMLVQNTKG